MSTRKRINTFIGPIAVALLFAACGSLNDGEIVIVDANGGSTNGGSSGSGGNAGNVVGNGGDVSSAGVGGVVTSDDPPTVVSVTPADAATDAEPMGTVEIEFSETLDTDTVTPDNVVILDGDVPVSGTLTFDSVRATFTPDVPLELLTTYTVTAKTALTDLAGQALTAEFTSTFTVRDGVWGNQKQISNQVGYIYGNWPAPAVDDHGNALYVWAQGAVADSSSYRVWGRFYNPGSGWGDSFRIDDLDLDCYLPKVAVNGSGDALVAWLEYDGSYYRVMARRYIDGAWEDMAHRVDTSDISNLYDINTAVSPGGDFHVVWLTNIYSDPYYYYYVYANHASGSADWLATENSVNFQSWDSASSLALAFDTSDNGFLFLTAGWSPNYYAWASRYLKADETWSYPTDVANSLDANLYPSSSWRPAVSTDASGGAMAIWSTDYDVVASRFTKAGGWTDATPIDTSDGYVYPQEFGLGYAAGDFATFWQQPVGSTHNAYSARYTTEWAAAGLLSDGDNSTLNGFSYYGWGFGLDRHGNGIAIWMQSNTRNSVTGNDVMFSRLVHSSGTWAAPGFANATQSDYYLSKLGVGWHGTAAVVWSTTSIDPLYGAIFQ